MSTNLEATLAGRREIHLPVERAKPQTVEGGWECDAALRPRPRRPVMR